MENERIIVEKHEGLVNLDHKIREMGKKISNYDQNKGGTFERYTNMRVDELKKEIIE